MNCKCSNENLFKSGCNCKEKSLEQLFRVPTIVAPTKGSSKLEEKREKLKELRDIAKEIKESNIYLITNDNFVKDAIWINGSNAALSLLAPIYTEPFLINIGLNFGASELQFGYGEKEKWEQVPDRKPTDFYVVENFNGTCRQTIYDSCDPLIEIFLKSVMRRKAVKLELDYDLTYDWHHSGGLSISRKTAELFVWEGGSGECDSILNFQFCRNKANVILLAKSNPIQGKPNRLYHKFHFVCDSCLEKLEILLDLLRRA